VDLNLVMTGSGGFVELQGTAEGMPFTPDELQAMLDLGRKGIDEIVATQRRILAQGREELGQPPA
jgi:ribonuclease PH